MPRSGHISTVERDKVLIAANGFCSFPRCQVDLADYLFEHDMAPKISHIVAAADAGPRADPTMSAEERNSFANLILLCDEHARAIDVMPVTEYTVDSLRRMKADHETRCAAARDAGAMWKGLVGEPNYVNLNRLFMDARPHAYAAGLVNTTVAPPRDFDSMSPMEFAHYIQFASRTASVIERFALRLTSRAQLSEENVGKRFIFWRRFRTKGVYDRDGRPRPLGTDYERGPHVYTMVDGVKVIMPIVARWVTSQSAKGLFGQGTVNFVGVATLRRVERGHAIMSPIVLGMAAEDAWERFADLRTAWFRGVEGGNAEWVVASTERAG